MWAATSRSSAQGNVLIDGTGSGIDVSGGLDGFGGYIDITAVDRRP